VRPDEKAIVIYIRVGPRPDVILEANMIYHIRKVLNLMIFTLGFRSGLMPVPHPMQGRGRDGRRRHSLTGG
jgi:hypothetical protein